MAAGGDPGNIKLGPGRLYVAELGTTEPTLASAALPSAWRPVGYTEEGHSVTDETTSEAIEVAEELDPVGYENTRRTGAIVFSMAERTRANLALALNMGATGHEGSDAIEPPDLGEEVRVMLLWDADPNDATASNIRWLWRQVFQSGNVERQARKAPQKRLLPVTFRVEKPATGEKVWKAWPNPAGLV